MSTQTILAIVGNRNMTRSFTDSSTDGTVFNSNNMLDTVASQNLGLLMSGTVIDHVAVTYAGGVAQWRIINSQNQVVARQGWASKVNYSCPEECKIPPYKIQPTDLLQIFPKAVNATSGDTELMAWVTTTGGIESFQVTTAADATLVEMTNSITGQSLGDWAFGKTLTHISVSAEDGGHLDACNVYDQTGSLVWSSYGQYRLPTAGGKSTQVNLDVPLNIKVEKGFVLKASATTA
ncbi:MAG: hypothetical protein CXX81_14010 [Methanobacteriota archaeon]|nr:MAG: hypothetical protein CXX81_14010 [Euryarchaeota archaeon]